MKFYNLSQGHQQKKASELDSVADLHRARQFQAIYDKLPAHGQRSHLSEDVKLLLAIACIWIGRAAEVSPLLGGAGPTERLLAKSRVARDWPAEDRQMLARYLMLRNPQDGDRIFLSTFPKSGSTFLGECILGATKNWTQEPINSNNTLMQMTMDSVMLTRALGRPNTLIRTHLSCSIKLQAYLVLYNIRPVVLIRNIFDALRSFVDHLATSYPEIVDGYPDLSFEDKKNVVLHLLALPLVEFFATWQMYAKTNPCLTIQYEENVDDWVYSLQKILDYSHIEYSPNAITGSVKGLTDQLSVNPGRFRYNEGIKGRGRDFSDEEKNSVRRLYKMYPNVDFQAIDSDA